MINKLKVAQNGHKLTLSYQVIPKKINKSQTQHMHYMHWIKTRVLNLHIATIILNTVHEVYEMIHIMLALFVRRTATQV